MVSIVVRCWPDIKPQKALQIFPKVAVVSPHDIQLLHIIPAWVIVLLESQGGRGRFWWSGAGMRFDLGRDDTAASLWYQCCFVSVNRYTASCPVRRQTGQHGVFGSQTPVKHLTSPGTIQLPSGARVIPRIIQHPYNILAS